MAVRGLIRTAAVVATLLALPGPAAASGSDATGGTSGDGRIDAEVYYYRGTWAGRRSACTWVPFSGDTNLDHVQGGPQLTRVRHGAVERAYWKKCPDHVGMVWVRPADPPSLVSTGSARVADLLPRPRPASAPPLDEAYVTVPTWFWTEGGWHDVAVTAWVPTPEGGSVWATTTARPTALRFDPGDGSPAVTCAGPGAMWTDADGDEAASECSVTFEHASARRPFRARLSIVWDVSWVGSNGRGGHLGTMETSRPVDAVVREIQAVGTS